MLHSNKLKVYILFGNFSWRRRTNINLSGIETLGTYQVKIDDQVTK